METDTLVWQFCTTFTTNFPQDRRYFVVTCNHSTLITIRVIDCYTVYRQASTSQSYSRHRCTWTIAESIDSLIEVVLSQWVSTHISQFSSSLDVVHHHFVELHNRSVSDVSRRHTARNVQQARIYEQVSEITCSSISYNAWTFDTQTSRVDIVIQTWVAVSEFIEEPLVTLVHRIFCLMDRQTICRQIAFYQRTWRRTTFSFSILEWHQAVHQDTFFVFTINNDFRITSQADRSCQILEVSAKAILTHVHQLVSSIFGSLQISSSLVIVLSIVLLPSTFEQHDAWHVSQCHCLVHMQTGNTVRNADVLASKLQVGHYMIHYFSTRSTRLVQVFQVCIFDYSIKPRHITVITNQLCIFHRTEETGNAQPVVLCFFRQVRISSTVNQLIVTAYVCKAPTWVCTRCRLSKVCRRFLSIVVHPVSHTGFCKPVCTCPAWLITIEVDVIERPHHGTVIFFTFPEIRGICDGIHRRTSQIILAGCSECHSGKHQT